MTQTLSSELADGHRKLLALAVAGANSKVTNPLVSQLSNGPLAGLHEKVCPLMFIFRSSQGHLKFFLLILAAYS